MHKPKGLDEMYTRILRELANEVAKALFNAVEKLGQAGGILSVWKTSHSLLKIKGRKEDVGNYRPISLTSVLAKIMEQILWMPC